MKKFILIIAVAFAMLANVNLKAQFADEDIDGWWDIPNYNALVTLASNPAYWGGQYELTNDITAPAFPLPNFTPIGTNQYPFTGKFKGRHSADTAKHKIINLREYWPGIDNVGLFGVSSGEIFEVTICSFNITGANNTAALCGTNDGLIYECEFYLNPNLTATTVTGVDCVGGLVGWNRGGSITDCHRHENPIPNYTYVSVTGSGQVGGLIGSNCQGLNNEVFNCEVYNIAVTGISSTHEIGAFVGFNGSSIYDCYVRAYSSVTIPSYGVKIGGFVGNSYNSTIGGCVVGDSVVIYAYPADYVGGFAGKNIAEIELCNSGSVVHGNGFVGGFIGLDSGNVLDCQSKGYVSGSDNNVGGFVGCHKGNIRSCFVTTSCSVNAQYSNFVGGFTGINFGHIDYSCSKAATSGYNSVAGFVGSNYGYIHESYSTGEVVGADSVAGFVGVCEPSGVIYQCFSTPIVIYGNDPGAFVQYNDYGWVGSCVVDARCGLNWDQGGVGWTTTLMKTSMLPYGMWNFTSVWEFNVTENDSFPSFIGYPNYKVNYGRNENVSNIEVYPNPVRDFSTINISDSEKGFTTVSVYNTNGEKVETLYSGDLNTNEYEMIFNGNNYTSGMYYLVLESNNGRKMEPIVVKH